MSLTGGQGRGQGDTKGAGRGETGGRGSVAPVDTKD